VLVGRALQKDGVIFLRIDPSCAIAVPPFHQQCAFALAAVGCDFQHGGLVLPNDWQKAARMGDDGFAV
jgi:hypothetical protein